MRSVGSSASSFQLCQSLRGKDFAFRPSNVVQEAGGARQLGGWRGREGERWRDARKRGKMIGERKTHHGTA